MATASSEGASEGVVRATAPPASDARDEAPPAWLGRAAFTLVAAAHLWGAGPSVGVRDAGELTTAAFLLDVAHPTGFVADLSLARAAMLAPLGDVAFRANALMALWTALAAALLTRLAYRASGEAFAGASPSPARAALALVPALALVTSPSLARAGTAMEVYALSLALCAGCFALLERGQRAASQPLLGPSLRALCLLAGSTVLVHTGARPAVLVALVALGSASLRALRASRAPLRGYLTRLAQGAGLALLGALPVLYLPVAARRHGPIDWGSPTTLAGTLAHLSAARIRGSYAQRLLVAWRVPEDLARAAYVLREDLGALALLAALAGAALAARHRALRWVALAGLADFFYAALVNPMGLGDRQNLFLAEACAVVLAGYAVARAAAWCEARRAGARPFVAGAGALALALGLLAHAAPNYSARADGFAPSELLGEPGALGAVPVGAVVLCEGDDLCGGAMYAQWVEGARPDVSVLPRQHLWDPSAWRRLRLAGEALAGQPRAEGRGPDELTARRLRWLVRRHPMRVRWQPGSSDDERVARAQLASGESPVLARVDGGPITAVDTHPWGFLAPRVTEGFWARRLAANVLSTTVRRVLPVDRAAAVRTLERAVALDATYATPLVNLGILRLEEQRFGEALGLFERAVAVDPDRASAWRRLELLYRARGDASAAERAAREAARR